MSRIIAHCTRRVRKLSYQRRHEGACYLQSTSMATTAISRIVATIQVPDSHISLVVGPDWADVETYNRHIQTCEQSDDLSIGALRLVRK